MGQGPTTGCSSDVTSEEGNVVHRTPTKKKLTKEQKMNVMYSPCAGKWDVVSPPQNARRVKNYSLPLKRGDSEPKTSPGRIKFLNRRKHALSCGDLFHCEVLLCIHGLNISMQQTGSEVGRMSQRFESMHFSAADIQELDSMEADSIGECQLMLEEKAAMRAKEDAAEEIERPKRTEDGSIVKKAKKEEPEKEKFPLVEDPYSVEIQEIVDKLMEQDENDQTLAYNNFTEPNPKLTPKQVEQNKGHDFLDGSLKLPSGPLLWPNGFPKPHFKPKDNYMTGHYIQVAGTNAAKKPSMFLRITQNGNDVTFDASVDRFKRAKRTWRSGRYMLEPLVSQDFLLGAWCVEGDRRLVGFFYSMNAGLCFRIERRLIVTEKYTFLRQANEFMGKVRYTYFVRVNHDSGSIPMHVKSRDYTALAGQDDVPTNTGEPYPCKAVDLGPKPEPEREPTSTPLVKQGNTEDESKEAGAKEAGGGATSGVPITRNSTTAVVDVPDAKKTDAECGGQKTGNENTQKRSLFTFMSVH